MNKDMLSPQEKGGDMSKLYMRFSEIKDGLKFHRKALDNDFYEAKTNDEHIFLSMKSTNVLLDLMGEVIETLIDVGQERDKLLSKNFCTSEIIRFEGRFVDKRD